MLIRRKRGWELCEGDATPETVFLRRRELIKAIAAGPILAPAFASVVATAEAQALKIRPWTIKIDGLVEKPMTVDVDDLSKKMTLEERLYRHRCVEAWSMAVPWSGFPMAALIDLAKPLGAATY